MKKNGQSTLQETKEHVRTVKGFLGWKALSEER